MTVTKNLIILLFSGFFLSGLTSCGGHERASSASKSIYDTEPVPVKTREVEAQNTGATTVLSGIVQSGNTSTVSSRMMGYITSMDLEIGDKVTAGQVIISIENNELPVKKSQVRANISEAEAALNNVKINYDRIKTLWEQASVTKKEWDDISAQHEMMKAKLEAANQMEKEIDELMAYTKVRAPITGYISAKLVNRGDLVNPGAPLLNIEGYKNYEVVAHVSDHQVSAVQLGMMLDCQIKAIIGTVKGKVIAVSPSAVNTGGQFTIKARLEPDSETLSKIFPGMYANVHIPVPSKAFKTSCTTVEKDALIQRGQLTGIYTVSEQNTALLRWIRTGKDFGDRIEVVSGLQPGEEYIISNLTQLRDGLPVSKS